MGDQSSDQDFTMNLNTEQNLTEKIKNAVESSHVPVIPLKSKNTQVKKFSVLENGDYEFAHQFKSDVRYFELVSLNLDYANVDLLRKESRDRYQMKMLIYVSIWQYASYILTKKKK